MDVIILAGGFGTRLQVAIGKQIPKPMAEINGEPFLTYLLDYILSEIKPEKFLFSVGHLHQVIANHFSNSYKNIPIEYVIENEPLGTGGAIIAALKKSNSKTSLVLNGDTLYKTSYKSFFDFHEKHQQDISVCLREVDDVSRYGAVAVEDNRICAFREKSNNHESGFINTGIYLFNKSVLNKYSFTDKFSIETDFFKKEVSNKTIMGFISNGYFIDIGIPEDYNKAKDEFKSFRN